MPSLIVAAFDAPQIAEGWAEPLRDLRDELSFIGPTKYREFGAHEAMPFRRPSSKLVLSGVPNRTIFELHLPGEVRSVFGCRPARWVNTGVKGYNPI